MKRTAVIGPGRVGTALGMALAAAGYRVEAVAGRTQASTDALWNWSDGDRPAGAEAARDAELVVVAVPDDALADVVPRWHATTASPRAAAGSTSPGGYGPEILRPVHLAGADVAACHPAQTFPDPEQGWRRCPVRRGRSRRTNPTWAGRGCS